MGRKSDAKERLLEVAFRLIWNHSYGGVSVDQICEQAKVNKGSFYYFYGTKADLAVAACDEHWRQKQPQMDKFFSAQIPPLERLSGWCQFIYEAQKSKASEYGHVCGCPYGSIGGEIATQDEKIRAKSEEMMDRTVRYLESAISDAKREGSISVTNSNQAARNVLSFVVGAMLQAKIHNDVQILKDLESPVMAMLGAKAAVTA